MQKIANIAGRVDLSKPLTQEQVERAIRHSRAANKPPTVRKAIKAGYRLEWIMPSLQGKVSAAIAGRTIQPLPRFVKG